MAIQKRYKIVPGDNDVYLVVNDRRDDGARIEITINDEGWSHLTVCLTTDKAGELYTVLATVLGHGLGMAA